MKIMMWDCPVCEQLTPHAEDPVTDLESATVWHCVFCGQERRPEEPSSPNEPALPDPIYPIKPVGMEKDVRKPNKTLKVLSRA